MSCDWQMSGHRLCSLNKVKIYPFKLLDTRTLSQFHWATVEVLAGLHSSESS